MAKRLARILVFVGVIVAINLGGNWLIHQFDFQFFPRHDAMMNLMVLGMAAVYVLLMAIPFMPGIEIGLALMILLGSKGALLVYLCTLAALTTSFLIGRIVPLRLLIRLLDWLRLERAVALLTRLEPLDRQQRLDLMYAQTPSRLLPLLLRHRNLAVMALLNLPGNAFIGGGGGIGIIAGMSRIFTFPVFVSLIAVATAPVPLLFYFEILAP
jgi:hypothetical protein